MYHVGIDWADQKHDIAIVDQHGEVIGKHLTITKNREGFEKLVEQLRKLSDDPKDFKIGIETSHNLLVDYLFDLGYAVYVILTSSMKSFRKRYRASNARDDKFDAFVLADVLRTDKKCWRKVDFGSDSVREIRLLAKDHHALVQDQSALTSLLRSTLKTYYPESIEFFTDVACSNSLAFLLAYPDFDSAKKLTREQLTAFFKEHKLRSGKTINKIYGLLHAEHLKAPEPLIRAKKYKTVFCAKRLISMASDIKEYIRLLTERLAQHPDSEIFLSYPGAAEVTAARLIALFGDNRKLYSDVSELQGLAGVSPVTEKSGKNFNVTYYRVACNKFYRDIMHKLAFSSLRTAPWALAHYQKHRAMGKSNNHALRCLANIHLRVLFAMWKTKTQYDENTFLAQRAKHQISNQKT